VIFPFVWIAAQDAVSLGVMVLSTQTHQIGHALCTTIGLQLGSVNIVKSQRRMDASFPPL